jgi:cell division septal protein FtsQ
VSEAWLTPAGPTGGRILPFRRRAVRPRRRRRSFAAALAWPVAAALLLVSSPLAATAWALTSPRFALADVVVTGTPRVPAAWLRRELGPYLGRNLLRLPLAEVDAAVARHPWVAAAEVSKRLPRTLAVAVVERRPAALIAVGEAVWFAQADGRPIAPAAADEGAGLVLVTRAPEAGADGASPGAGVPVALAVAAELARVRPEWAQGLTRVEALSEDDVRLHTAALPFPLVVRAGRLEPGVGRLADLLPQLAARYPALAAVDLRFARRVVLRPAPAAAVTETASTVVDGTRTSTRGGAHG